MLNDQQVRRAKAGVLELAKQFGNASQARKMMGYSRDSFYRCKLPCEKGGEIAVKEISRRKPIVKKGVAPEIEQPVVELAVEHPPGGRRAYRTNCASSGCRYPPSESQGCGRATS